MTIDSGVPTESTSISQRSQNRGLQRQRVGGGWTLWRLHEQPEQLYSHWTFCKLQTSGRKRKREKTAIFRGCPMHWRWGKENVFYPRGGGTQRLRTQSSYLYNGIILVGRPSSWKLRGGGGVTKGADLPLDRSSWIPNFIFPVQSTTVNPSLPRSIQGQEMRGVYRAGGGSWWQRRGWGIARRHPCSLSEQEAGK